MTRSTDFYATKLLSLRNRIDAVDDQVLRLLNERAQLAQHIGHLKNGIVYKPEREAQVVRRMQADNPGPLPAGIDFRALQGNHVRLPGAGTAADHRLPGAAGHVFRSRRDQAFRPCHQGLPCASIDDVFRAVERGEAHYGVAPVENSTEGRRQPHPGPAGQQSLKVCGEVMLRVRQHLMRKGEGLDGIEVIYSHAQSLGQCHEWLAQHLRGVVPSSHQQRRGGAHGFGKPGCRRHCRRTGGRALWPEHRRARHRGRSPTTPPVSWCWGRKRPRPPAATRPRWCCRCATIAPAPCWNCWCRWPATSIGLSKLESRPARNGAWEYVFYIDHRRPLQSIPTSSAPLQCEITARRFRENAWRLSGRRLLKPMPHSMSLRTLSRLRARHRALPARQADLRTGPGDGPERSRHRQAGLQREPAWRQSKAHALRLPMPWMTWRCIRTATVTP
jgi:chorismate mutase/prephenate dehydratase